MLASTWRLLFCFVSFVIGATVCTNHGPPQFDNSKPHNFGSLNGTVNLRFFVRTQPSRIERCWLEADSSRKTLPFTSKYCHRSSKLTFRDPDYILQVTLQVSGSDPSGRFKLLLDNGAGTGYVYFNVVTRADSNTLTSSTVPNNATRHAVRASDDFSSDDVTPDSVTTRPNITASNDITVDDVRTDSVTTDPIIKSDVTTDSKSTTHEGDDHLNGESGGFVDSSTFGFLLLGAIAVVILLLIFITAVVLGVVVKRRGGLSVAVPSPDVPLTTATLESRVQMAVPPPWCPSPDAQQVTEGTCSSLGPCSPNIYDLPEEVDNGGLSVAVPSPDVPLTPATLESRVQMAVPPPQWISPDAQQVTGGTCSSTGACSPNNIYDLPEEVDHDHKEDGQERTVSRSPDDPRGHPCNYPLHDPSDYSTPEDPHHYDTPLPGFGNRAPHHRDKQDTPPRSCQAPKNRFPRFAPPTSPEALPTQSSPSPCKVLRARRGSSAGQEEQQHASTGAGSTCLPSDYLHPTSSSQTWRSLHYE